MARRACFRIPVVLLGVATGSLLLTGCFSGGGGGGGNSGGGPAACQSAGTGAPAAAAPPTEDGPIAPGEAADQAREAVAASGQRTAGGDIPFVTVEETAHGPEITSTPVADAAEAADVAEAAAADGDLVAVEVDVPVHADSVSNDPLRGQQWSLDNVKYEDAWATTNGTGEVVAVVDTGVTASHPDLSGRVLAGEYFLHTASGIALDGAGGTTDANGHGTHVAGIIGAVAGNGTGITGAAPGVKILPVQVLCPDGDGWASDVANGIRWAADHGADVVNLSLGSNSPSSSELSAIQYARSLGVVVVAAGGNDGAGGPALYPGAYAEVVGVAAVKNDNTRASYSTTGSYLDLAAPGGSASGSSATQVLSTWKDGGYVSISGTSMATPHVSAAVALVLAAHPTYTPAQACTQLVRTADDLGAAGVDVEYGYGLVDPLEAVGVTVPTGPSCS